MVAVAKRKPKPVKHTFAAARVRELREARGMTQEKLGELIGKNHVAISRIESASVQPTLDTASRIAIALGVSLDELINSQ